MQGRYQVQFERQLSAATSLNNYEYLDLLDRAFAAVAEPRPLAALVCDIGCASFWYAASLQAFFQARELVGIEIEGHRLFRDGRTRIDYAHGYLSGLPNAHFMVADYKACELPADVITAWFPFVTPAAILAWRLPLSLLEPKALFARIRQNLRTGGRFVMVNHGTVEAGVAAGLCSAAGLRPLWRFGEPGVFGRARPVPAILSCWARN